MSRHSVLGAAIRRNSAVTHAATCATRRAAGIESRYNFFYRDRGACYTARGTVRGTASACCDTARGGP